MITIVDYGMGNSGSIVNMFKRIGIAAEITGDAERIAKATKIILPGVGAFDTAMQKINDSGFKEALNDKVLNEKIPILGICLGMQLMTNKSEEGVLPGLGWINGEVRKFAFPTDASMKVPHMGWNIVTSKDKATNLIEDSSRFYFVHSYYATVENNLSLGQTTYGHSFDSVITNGDNIIGAQFHPEKSHKYGMQFLKQFAAM